MERLRQIIHTFRSDEEARSGVIFVIALILFLCWWGATGHWDDSPYLPSFLR